MALFTKNGTTAVPTTRTDHTSEQINLVGQGTTFEGTLRAEGDVRIGGCLIGKVVAKGRVIVSEHGLIDGELYADAADVAGRLKGTTHVEGRLELRRSARVEGVVRAGGLVVEEGAHLSGDCEMGEGVADMEGAGPASEKDSAKKASARTKAQGDGATADVPSEDVVLKKG